MCNSNLNSLKGWGSFGRSLCSLNAFVTLHNAATFSQRHIPAEWQRTVAIWGSPKWRVMTMECTTVRCLATASLGRPGWRWLFWVRSLFNHILKMHRSISTPAQTHMTTLKLLVGSLTFVCCNVVRYVPQCRHLHLCVGSPTQWRQASRPSCPAMTTMAHLLHNTSGTKMASSCPPTRAKLLASKMPPTN